MPRPEDSYALNLARIVHRLLTSPRGWEVEELRRELGISDRTYRKYRKNLQERFRPFHGRKGESTVREVHDGETTYLRLVEGPPIEFGSADLVASMSALQLARQAFGFLDETQIRGALDDLWLEFRERISDKRFVLRHLFRNLDRMLHCVPDAPKDYSKQGEKLRAILHGLVFTEHLIIDYHGTGEPRQHKLEPLTLMMHRSALYLIARRPGEKRPYTYAVDRIAKVTPGREKFVYPEATQFDPARHFEGSFGIFLSPEGEGKKTDVELVFASKRWLQLAVRERRWHPTQKFRELPDGRLEMKFKVENMVEVWPWIRGFGDDVVVRRPRGEAGRQSGTT